MTQDIDIDVAPDPANSARWVAALSHLPDHATAEMAGEAAPFDGDHLHAIRINDEFTVDILPSVAGIPYSELEVHARTLDIEGGAVRVLDLEGLLMTKQGVRLKKQELLAIGKQCAALPVLDDRTPEEILGYDQYGVTR